MENKLTEINDLDVTLYDTGLLKALVQDVRHFIASKHLYCEINKRNYVYVEGLQYMGGRLGLVAIPRTLTALPSARELICTNCDKDGNISKYDYDKRITVAKVCDLCDGTKKLTEIKYMAEVELIRIKTGQKVGTGFAICSNAEGKKRTFAEYAIASMCQTRGIGKAFRSIGYILKLAGYEPLSAEEVTDDHTDNQEQKEKVMKDLTDKFGGGGLIDKFSFDKLKRLYKQCNMDMSLVTKEMTQKEAERILNGLKDATEGKCDVKKDNGKIEFVYPK